MAAASAAAKLKANLKFRVQRVETKYKQNTA